MDVCKRREEVYYYIVIQVYRNVGFFTRMLWLNDKFIILILINDNENCKIIRIIKTRWCIKLYATKI